MKLKTKLELKQQAIIFDHQDTINRLEDELDRQFRIEVDMEKEIEALRTVLKVML